jgi:hypothetical protein
MEKVARLRVTLLARGEAGGPKGLREEGAQLQWDSSSPLGPKAEAEARKAHKRGQT